LTIFYQENNRCKQNQQYLENLPAFINRAEFAHNNAKPSSAQCSPFLNNYEFDQPLTVIPGALRSTNVPDAKGGASYIKDITDELILHLEAAATKMKLFADVHRGETPTFLILSNG
jgi:hypothetical protein